MTTLRRPTRSSWTIAHSLIAITLVASCSGGSDPGVTEPPAKVVTSVNISPVSPQLAIGETVALNAVVRDQDGEIMTGQTLTWSSTSNSVATVNAAGLVTAVSGGSSTISASTGGKTGTTVVTVRPAVASLSLSADTVALATAATLQLTATLRDAGGVTLAPRPITWSSSSPSATVSNAGLVTAVQLGLSRIIASAEGKSDTTVILVPASPVTAIRETANAKSATIDAAGGTIQATDADGVQYTLTIPPLSLKEPVLITMTPLANVTGLPLSGGFVAGVDFQPSGLVFADPAVLTIATNPQAPAGQRLVGFTATSTGQNLLMTQAGTAANSIRIPVKHFSLLGIGFGTTQDIDALYFSNFTPGQQPLTGGLYVHALVYLTAQAPPDAASVQEIYHKWFDTWIMPRLQSVNSDVELVNAIADFRDWNEETPDLLGLFAILPGGENSPALTSRRAQWTTTMIAKIKEAIAGNNTTCNNSGTNANRLAALNNALFWYDLGRIGFSLHTASNGLTIPSFVSALCAKVVTQSLTLANPLSATTNSTLTAQFALNFSNGQAIVPANFDVKTTAIGASHQLPQRTASSPVGSFTGTVIGVAGAAAIIDLEVCYAGATTTAVALGGTVLCHIEHIVRTVSSPLVITTGSLPNGQVMSGYSTTVNASGGSGGYEWSISLNSLPPGLTLNASNGTIIGTPITAGTYNFNVQVTSAHLQTEKSFTIVISPFTSPPSDCPDTRIDNNARYDASKNIACALNMTIGGFNNSLTVHVLMPNLTRVVEAFAVGLSGSEVPGGLSLPALSQLSGSLFSMSKLATLDLPALARNTNRPGSLGDLDISLAPDLVTINMPALTLVEGSLIIQGNPKLANINGIPCGVRIGKDLIIQDNPELSNTAALAKANCMIVQGKIMVQRNKP